MAIWTCRECGLCQEVDAANVFCSLCGYRPRVSRTPRAEARQTMVR